MSFKNIVYLLNWSNRQFLFCCFYILKSTSLCIWTVSTRSHNKKSDSNKRRWRKYICIYISAGILLYWLFHLHPQNVFQNNSNVLLLKTCTVFTSMKMMTFINIHHVSNIILKLFHLNFSSSAYLFPFWYLLTQSYIIK